MKRILMSLVMAAALAGSVWAQDQEERLKELERKIGILTEEIERGKLGEAAREYQSEYGFGPAASMVYSHKYGVSIAGYGEMLYEHFADVKQDGAASGSLPKIDFLRQIIYMGYRFSDSILFNSEIEFEHANSKLRGEVGVEFAYLDFLLGPSFGIRTGLLLLPIGFVNELHEPPIFLGAKRPDVENNLIPTTWRENGVGIFGEISQIMYRAYLVNGLQAMTDGTVTGFSGSGIRNGRQKGSSALAKGLGIAVRTDYKGIQDLLLGGSVYAGNSGQGKFSGSQEITAATLLWELHADWKWQGWQARGLYTQTTIQDTTQINVANALTGNKSVGEFQYGWYVELGYDLFTMMNDWKGQSLIPFVRYERYNTQASVPAGYTFDPANDKTVLTAGLTYKPHSQIAIKGDAQIRGDNKGTGVNQYNLSAGFMF